MLVPLTKIKIKLITMFLLMRARISDPLRKFLATSLAIVQAWFDILTLSIAAMSRNPIVFINPKGYLNLFISSMHQT